MRRLALVLLAVLAAAPSAAQGQDADVTLDGTVVMVAAPAGKLRVALVQANGTKVVRTIERPRGRRAVRPRVATDDLGRITVVFDERRGTKPSGTLAIGLDRNGRAVRGAERLKSSTGTASFLDVTGTGNRTVVVSGTRFWLRTRNERFGKRLATKAPGTPLALEGGAAAGTVLVTTGGASTLPNGVQTWAPTVALPFAAPARVDVGTDGTVLIAGFSNGTAQAILSGPPGCAAGPFGVEGTVVAARSLCTGVVAGTVGPTTHSVSVVTREGRSPTAATFEAPGVVDDLATTATGSSVVLVEGPRAFVSTISPTAPPTPARDIGEGAPGRHVLLETRAGGVLVADLVAQTITAAA